MVFADMREVAGGSVLKCQGDTDQTRHEPTHPHPNPPLIRLQMHIQQVLAGEEGGGEERPE